MHLLALSHHVKEDWEEEEEEEDAMIQSPDGIPLPGAPDGDEALVAGKQAG